MSIYYLSQLLKIPVLDRSGEKIATAIDLISRFGPDYPIIVGLVARARRRNFFITWDQVQGFTVNSFQLSTYTLDFHPFARRAGEILLARDLLDKQIIDVDDRRVVRVNDVQLADTRQGLTLVGVDVSFQGLLRRLFPKNFLTEHKLPHIIDWANVEYLATEAPSVKLNVRHEKIAKLHPVEIARLIEELSYRQEAEIINSLNIEQAADTIEELSVEHQAEILARMTEEQAAQLLEHMSPDEAADLLADLSEERAEELLERMSPAESEDVRELLAYEQHTAGGIMTNQFVAVRGSLTAEQAINELRALSEHPDLLYDIYLVEDEQHLKLLGVISLKELVLARPATPVLELIQRQIVSVEPAQEALQVARTMAEYNLMTIPVVDKLEQILGIVTIDDAIELLIPE